MDMIHAIAYGVVQGLTEFLPVSSSGHLALLHAFFGGSDPASAVTFDIALHIATAGAVIVYFWSDITRLIYVCFRMANRLPVDIRDATLLKAIIVGAIPAGVAGLFLEHIIEDMFRAPLMIALVLLAGSAYLAVAERHARGLEGKPLTVRRGLLIGVAQILALFPGFSRSGATIGAGMMLGLSRADAARFSFLLALPLILAAGAVKLLGVMRSGIAIEWDTFWVGGVAAFAVGLFVIKFLLQYVRSHSLYPFIWYRVALATVVIVVSLLQ